MIDGRQSGESPLDPSRLGPLSAAGPGERPDDDEVFPELEPEPDGGEAEEGWDSPAPADEPSIEVGFTIDLDGDVDDERGGGRKVPH